MGYRLGVDVGGTFTDLLLFNVDTGACFGGPLTAVVLAPGERPRFLRA